MKNYFKNKVVIITGASSGIGLATARAMADEFAKVVIAARREEKLKEYQVELSKKTEVLSVKTDVSCESDCKRLIEKTVERFGHIDILINNAGVSMRALFKDLDLSVLKRSMDINYWGTVFCTKYALPYLLETKGSVCGVISIAGFKGLPGRTGYSSSKFAINGFLDSVRVEHLRDGLHVMIFAPGYTASNVRYSAMLADGSKQGSTPRQEDKMMSAEQCAHLMLKGLRKHKRTMILTPIGRITVFLNKWCPALLDKLELWFISKEDKS
ncbi:MAG: SDR family oxidoreductase [Bacteroidales bacterium]